MLLRVPDAVPVVAEALDVVDGVPDEVEGLADVVEELADGVAEPDGPVVLSLEQAMVVASTASTPITARTDRARMSPPLTDGAPQ
jgi:hypothetical protein